METTTAMLISVFPALLIAAALRDVGTMTIPNWISAALIVGFFPTAFAVGLAPIAVAAHVGAGLVALMIGAGLFAARVFGGGDAKVMAAACLWLGFAATPQFLMWTAAAGGVFALTLVLVRGQLAPYAAAAPGWVGRLLTPKGDIPYGVAIAAGALAAYPESPLVRGFTGVF
ncbi:MAG TPA: prepilin peptidase [Caulobacteraceae bacterium]|nr:prepilin peptidase [Caulobacteraceae bacterium]